MKFWVQSTYPCAWHMASARYSYWLHGLWSVLGVRRDNEMKAVCTESQVGPHRQLHRVSWRRQYFHTGDQALLIFSAHNDSRLPWVSNKLLIRKCLLVLPPLCSLPWLSQALLVALSSACITLVCMSRFVCIASVCSDLVWCWLLHPRLWGLTNQSYSVLHPAQGLANPCRLKLKVWWFTGDEKSFVKFERVYLIFCRPQ